MCHVGDTTVAGIFFMQGDRFAGMPEHWPSYFSVKDVDAAVERARRAGAVIKREPFDVSEIGRFAIIQSPAGSVAGWMMPEPMPESRKTSQ